MGSELGLGLPSNALLVTQHDLHRQCICQFGNAWVRVRVVAGVEVTVRLTLTEWINEELFYAKRHGTVELQNDKSAIPHLPNNLGL